MLATRALLFALGLPTAAFTFTTVDLLSPDGATRCNGSEERVLGGLVEGGSLLGPPPGRCPFTLRAARDGQAMLILVRRFVVDPDNCTQNALEIYEGRADSGSSNSSGPLARVCSEHVGGAATPRTIIASSGRELTVSLLLMSGNATNLNLSVAFSAFTAGVGCLADEFSCTNGRCVSVTLLCAGVDFCGDDSNNAAPSCHVNASMGGSSSSSSMAPVGSVGSTAPSSSLLLPLGVTLALLLLLLLLLAGLLCRSSCGCLATRLCRCCCSGCVAGTASLCLAGPLCVARGRIRRRRSVRSARSGGGGGGGGGGVATAGPAHV